MSAHIDHQQRARAAHAALLKRAERMAADAADDREIAEVLYVGECYGCASDEVIVALPFRNALPKVTRRTARLPIHVPNFEQHCERCEQNMLFTFLRYRTDDEPEGVTGAPRVVPTVQVIDGIRILE